MSAPPSPGWSGQGYYQPPARRRGGGWRTFGTWLWVFLPVFTFGLLSPLPVFTAAIVLRELKTWLWTFGYVVAAVVFYVLVNISDSETQGVTSTVGVLLWLSLLVGCTVHAAILRSRVFPPAAPVAQIGGQGNQWAYAEAQAARQRREEARALAARDPVMARDLRIGRPDLRRHFDDGGLVDVNHVPLQVLVTHLGLQELAGRRVVEARGQLGGFSMPEELTALAGVPPAEVDWVQDRMVFPRY